MPITNRYWIPLTDSTYNDSFNWSVTSGGPGGASIPDTSCNAFFDSSVTGSCHLDSSINIYGLILGSDYTNTVFLDNDATVNSLSLYGGKLKDNTGTIHCQGDLICDSGFGSYSTDHDATIFMDSTDAQGIFISGGILPYLFINKQVTNQVKIHGTGDLFINQDFRIMDGTVNSNGHDIKVGA